MAHRTFCLILLKTIETFAYMLKNPTSTRLAASTRVDFKQYIFFCGPKGWARSVCVKSRPKTHETQKFDGIKCGGSYIKQLVCTHRVHFDFILGYITLKISGASHLWRGLKGDLKRHFPYVVYFGRHLSAKCHRVIVEYLNFVVVY